MLMAGSPRSFLQRWLVGAAAAFGLVLACSVSLQPHVLSAPEHLLAICVGVLIASVPAGAIAAAVVRRNELWLVVGSQVLVVAALAAWALAKA